MDELLKKFTKLVSEIDAIGETLNDIAGISFYMVIAHGEDAEIDRIAAFDDTHISKMLFRMIEDVYNLVASKDGVSWEEFAESLKRGMNVYGYIRGEV